MSEDKKKSRDEESKAEDDVQLLLKPLLRDLNINPSSKEELLEKIISNFRTKFSAHRQVRQQIEGSTIKNKKYQKPGILASILGRDQEPERIPATSTTKVVKKEDALGYNYVNLVLDTEMLELVFKLICTFNETLVTSSMRSEVEMSLSYIRTKTKKRRHEDKKR